MILVVLVDDLYVFFIFLYRLFLMNIMMLVLKKLVSGYVIVNFMMFNSNCIGVFVLYLLMIISYICLYMVFML